MAGTTAGGTGGRAGRPPGRYGAAPRRSRRLAGLVALAVAAALFLAVTVWVAWEVATPDVRSGLISYGDTTDASVEVRFEVVKDAGATVACTVRALDRDRRTVGSAETVLGPPRYDERSVVAVTVATTRRPVAAELIRCVVIDGT